MWALAPALALASIPPNIDLEDIDRWETAAEYIIDLPQGCWEWVGQASWDWETGRFNSRGDAVFAGKTTNGLWGEVHLQPLGELLSEPRGTTTQVYERQNARFAPLVGRLHGGRVIVSGDEEAAALAEEAEAINVLRDALSRISGDAFTSWAEWDDARGGVVLNRAIPLAEGRSEEILVAIYFPSGGDVPSLLDVTFPAKFRAGKWPGFSVRDAEVHVRGLIRGSYVYPSSEAFRFDYRFLGFKYHGAQTVVYKRISRCEGLFPEEPVSVSPPDGSLDQVLIETADAQPPPQGGGEDPLDGVEPSPQDEELD